MLTIAKIQATVQEVAAQYPIRKVSLFGSYAEGRATEASDVDLLIEYETHPTSLFDVLGFEQQMRDALNVHVDALQTPILHPIDPNFRINKVVPLYAK